MLSTPVAFIIFNRPESTRKVFEAIKKAKPSILLVVADGPRPGRIAEKEKCDLARQIIETVDWDCEVLKNYSSSNMGCKARVSSGIDWVFENVEEAIILEDDCLPHPTFFMFCQELLAKYRYDNRVVSISGANFQFGKVRTSYSYYFSRYSIIWGWASWRRVWKNYDVNMLLWPEINAGKWLHDIFPDKEVRKYWTTAFEDVYGGLIDTWDYQFQFASIINNGLSVIPNKNLVSNIGFGPNATRTIEPCKVSNIPLEEIDFPLNCPPYVIRDKIADYFTERDQYVIHSLPTYVVEKFKHLYIAIKDSMVSRAQKNLK